MGLFRPGWQSKNREKALKAVARETDEQKLVMIALDAADDVALAALDKINNQMILMEFAMGKRFEVESKAVVLMKDPSYEVRNAALDKLQDVTDTSSFVGFSRL